MRDINQCPSSIRPSCPAGQTFCIDGNCHDTCPTNLESQCACPGQPALTTPMFACNKQTADIPNFVATNKTEQAAAACGAAVNIQGGLPDWNSANPTGIMWGECPAPDYGTLNFHEPVFLALWVYYGSLVGFLIIWLMYKTAREKVKIEIRNRRSFLLIRFPNRSSRHNTTRQTH